MTRRHLAWLILTRGVAEVAAFALLVYLWANDLPWAPIRALMERLT